MKLRLINRVSGCYLDRRAFTRSMIPHLSSSYQLYNMAIDEGLTSVDCSTHAHSKLRRFLVRKFHQILDTKSYSLTKQRKWQTIKKAIPSVENQCRQQAWIQLAGHQDSFAVGEQGTILKKLQTNEKEILEKLMTDGLQPFVPQYKGIVNIEDNSYIEMQNLLDDFDAPCVMDCKMGTRTYLEEELTKLEKNPEPRKDMYEKMVKVDPNEPTDEEHTLGAVTKPRYMQWRERISSSQTLGFRIEGIKNSKGEAYVDFKNCRDKEAVGTSLAQFTSLDENILRQYLERLTDLRQALSQSKLFTNHELIGSSLLFVHDKNRASVWMIDFGKTTPVPEGLEITHSKPWIRGNHEDGYLTGIDNIIELFEGLLNCSH